MEPALHVIRVESFDDPELLPYRTLRRPVEHFQRGIFVAEGERVVLRLLESGLEVESLLLTPQWLERVSGHLEERRQRAVRVYLAEAVLLRQIVGYNLHQGIMAVGKVPPEPSPGSLPQPHMLVALEGLTQAENVGVIARNSAGFGVDALISGETSGSPYLRRAVRNSMGAVFSLGVIHSRRLAETLATLRETRQTRIIATVPHAGTPLTNVDLRGNICFVAGNEDAGISRDLRDLSDVQAAIPMQKGTDSLNVANAVAVFLYEACRQRQSS